MRYLKISIVAAIFALSSLLATAQRSDRNIPESVLLNTKFSRDLVWDVQRFPISPIYGREWKLSGLKAPYDVDTKSILDWGNFNSRYLMFDIEIDNYNRQGSLLDERTGKRYSVSLNLYDTDGRFIKRVSRWGRLMGLGSAGFMYEQEGRFGTFFSVSHQREGDIIVYRPELILANNLSNIVNVGRDNGNVQYGKDDHRNDNQGRYDNNRDSKDNFEGLTLTNRRFREEGSIYLKDAIRKEFRGECEIADWNDVKRIPNINAWISSMRLKQGQTFMVTKSGKFTYGDKRQYFVLYSPYGELPMGFQIHDKIANKLFLGSWYGEPRQVLVKDRLNN